MCVADGRGVDVLRQIDSQHTPKFGVNMRFILYNKKQTKKIQGTFASVDKLIRAIIIQSPLASLPHPGPRATWENRSAKYLYAYLIMK